MNENDPKLQRLMSKIATLERRADHLQRQLDQDQCSNTARSFIAAELGALEAAMIAMRLHHAEVEGLAKPIAVMGELVAALEKVADNDQELTRLLERASVAVLEYEALARVGQEGKEHDERTRSRAVG